jgi:hypothetical protein
MLPYNFDNIIREISSARYRCNNSTNYPDDFESWGIKQDLYKIKWHIEDELRKCPKFERENRWLKEQELQKIIRILKDGTP